MKKIALVLVTVLLVMVVGACGKGRQEATVTEQDQISAGEMLDKIFIDFAAMSIVDYEALCTRVLEAVDTGGHFIRAERGPNVAFLYKYSDLVDFNGLKASVETGREDGDDFLFIIFRLEDNPEAGGLDEILSRSLKMSEEAFKSGWNKETRRHAIEVEDNQVSVMTMMFELWGYVTIGMLRQSDY